MGRYTTYAEDIQEQSEGAVLTYTTQSFVGSGSFSPWFPLQAPPGYNIGGILVDCVIPLTASGAATAIGGTDALDLFTQGYEVSASPGSNARCRCITRKGVEEAERIFVNPNSLGLTFVYPRAAAHTFGGAGSFTQENVFIIPACGGDGVNVRIQIPNITTTYATNVTGSVQYIFYVIPTLTQTSTAYAEILTPVLPTGISDISVHMPSSMAPDYADFVATTTAVVGSVQVTDQNGIISIDQQSAATINAANSLFPGVAASNTLGLLFNMRRQRARRFAVNMLSSASLDVLWAEMTENAPSAGTPNPSPSGTPVPPIRNDLGRVAPGRIAVVPARGRGFASGLVPNVQTV